MPDVSFQDLKQACTSKFFSIRLQEQFSMKTHGEPYRGDSCYYFVVSTNKSFTSLDDDKRHYRVYKFTASGEVQSPYDKDSRLDRDARRLDFTDESKALDAAKSLSEGKLNPNNYEWY